MNSIPLDQAACPYQGLWAGQSAVGNLQKSKPGIVHRLVLRDAFKSHWATSIFKKTDVT